MSLLFWLVFFVGLISVWLFLVRAVFVLSKERDRQDSLHKGQRDV